VGFDHAKKHKPPEHKGEWFNQLDEKLRKIKRNETQGVAIGPGTSNILSEIILARVDAQLAKEFTYIRYIDDYTAYCETEEEAQKFIRRLGEELAKYKLLLNS
jgi:sugar phosphate isomerase/epimerase